MIWATPAFPLPAWVSAGHSTVEPLLSVQVVGAAFTRYSVKFCVVPEPSERWATVMFGRRQRDTRVVGGDGGIVPRLDRCARRSWRSCRADSCSLSTPFRLYDTVIGREQDREVQNRLGWLVGVGEGRVRTGEVDDLALQIGASLAGTAAAVGDGGPAVGLGEGGDGFVLIRLLKRRTAALDRAGHLDGGRGSPATGRRRRRPAGGRRRRRRRRPSWPSSWRCCCWSCQNRRPRPRVRERARRPWLPHVAW